MQSESVDVPHLLARRKQKHIGTRAVAEILDVVVIAIASDVLIAVIGDPGTLFLFPALVLYFTLFEAHCGQTPGKRLLRIRVVNSSGAVPTFAQSLIRNLVRPFEAFGFLGLILVSSTEKGQRIGDFLASTFVVQSDELQALANLESQVATNTIQSSRQVIPLTINAQVLATSLIAIAYEPAATGLTIAADAAAERGLVVQLDFIDTSDDSWHYTTDGVTISVPRKLASQCNGLQVGVRDGKLVVEQAT